MSHTFSLPAEQHSLLITRIIPFLQNRCSSLNEQITSERAVVNSLSSKIEYELEQIQKLDLYKAQLERYEGMAGGTQKAGQKEKRKSANSVLREVIKEIDEERTKEPILPAQEQRNPNQPKSQQCNIKSHIHQYLGSKDDLSLKLDSLNSKLSRLLAKTKTILTRDQPYCWEKILQNIEKQMKLKGQNESLAEIKKEISKCLKRSQSQQQSTGSKSATNIAAMLAQNVSLLKEIKERKILNNDQIYEFCNQQDNSSVGTTKSPAFNAQLSTLKKVITDAKNSKQMNIEKREQPPSSNDRVIQIIQKIDEKTKQTLADLQPSLSFAFSSKQQTVQSDIEITKIKRRIDCLKQQLAS